MLIDLHKNATLDVHVVTKEKNRIDYYYDESIRRIEKRLVTDTTNYYIVKYLYIAMETDEVILKGDYEILYFMELVNSFASKKLSPDTTYDSIGKFRANISRRDKKHYLRIIRGDEECYFSSFCCSLILRNFNKIYSKCTHSKFAKEENLI